MHTFCIFWLVHHDNLLLKKLRSMKKMKKMRRRKSQTTMKMKTAILEVVNVFHQNLFVPLFMLVPRAETFSLLRRQRSQFTAHSELLTARHQRSRSTALSALLIAHYRNLIRNNKIKLHYLFTIQNANFQKLKVPNDLQFRKIRWHS